MQPPIILPARKRLTWHVLLDMPVGLTPPRDTPEGPARSLILEGRAPDDGTEPGWLVLLDVSNTGWSSIYSTEFTTPLSFAFPSRHVLAAWMSAEPVARRTVQSGVRPTIRIPTGIQEPHPGDGEPDYVQLGGFFVLRPADTYSLTFILTGTPTVGLQPSIRLNGALSAGKVTACPRQ